MARTCSVCLHASRTEIEREIIAGTSIRQLASKHDLHEAALRRHTRTHLRKALTKALEKQERFEVDADRLVEWTHALHTKTLLILERAEQLDDLKAAARLIGEARRNLELMGRIVGAIDAPRVSIDMRRQYAVLNGLDEHALRALASGDVIEGEAEEIAELEEAVA